MVQIEPTAQPNVARQQEQIRQRQAMEQARNQGRHDAQKRSPTTHSPGRMGSPLGVGPLAGIGGASRQPRLAEADKPANRAYNSAYRQEATKQAAAKQAEAATKAALKATKIGAIPGVGEIAGKLVGGLVKEIMEHKEIAIALILMFTAPFWIFFLIPLAPIVLFVGIAWAVRSTVSS